MNAVLMCFPLASYYFAVGAEYLGAETYKLQVHGVIAIVCCLRLIIVLRWSEHATVSNSFPIGEIEYGVRKNGCHHKTRSNAAT